MAVRVSDFYKIDIQAADIISAANTATLKYLNMGYPGFVPRNPMKTLDDIFRGDLAKATLKRLLAYNGIVIVDYDDIRTDDFQDPRSREWHITANGNTKIEINSSIKPSGWSEADIVNQGDIKITKIGNTPFDLTYDIAVQMYYINLDNFDLANERYIPTLTADNSATVLPDILSAYDRYHEVIGVAWASQNDVNNFRLTNLHRSVDTTWSFRNSTRLYWKCKIADCNPFIEVLRVL